MKNIAYLTSVTFIIIALVSCEVKTDKEVQVQKDFSLTLGSLKLENSKLTQIIKDYIKENNGNPSRVYTLLVQREDLITTSFQLSSIVTYSELNSHIPTGYFFVNDDIMLVYSGLEQLCQKDEIFFKNLEGIIGDRIVNDLLPDGKINPDSPPMVFDPSVWEVSTVRDSTSIEKGVMNLLGPPVVNKIKFLPPKVK